MMDNSNNFVKALMQFGTEAELLPDLLEDAADPTVEGIKDMVLDLVTGDVDKFEYISVDMSSGLGLYLPVHM